MEQVNKKLMSWASIIEPDTLEQAKTTSGMPFIFPHMALMPDAHLGKGATVGSVIPTERAIIPAAVGVDIGCGMIAVKTQFHTEDLRARGSLTPLRERIENTIPLSAGNYNETLTPMAADRADALAELASKSRFNPEDYDPNWKRQLGSLGSGNHFIEVTADETDAVWLFLHSGSRGIGNKIAQHHIKVARQLMERYYIDLPDPDLAYLVEGIDEFWKYIRELMWAQEFALQNRAEMMDRTALALSEFMNVEVERLDTVQCHHNYTAREEHFGRELWVSRKGAIDAYEGVMGLIPGSMGTASYVVEGLGNPLSLCSAPHGAGRNYSRSKARKTFTGDQLREAMQGIEYRDTDAFIDEIPMAYKDIDVVMEDAKDLVKIRHTLRQLVNVKGD